MKQETTNSYDIAIQQKRVWKYILDKNRSEIALLQIHIAGVPDVGRLQQAILVCTAEKEIFNQVYNQYKGFNFPVTYVSSQGNQLLIMSAASDPQDRMNEARQSYDKGEPFAFFLVEAGKENFILEVYFPALSFDKTSCALFFEALCRQYFKEKLSGHTDESEFIQFIDFSEWQNDVLSEEAENGKSYWNNVMNKEVPLFIPYAKHANKQLPDYHYRQVIIPQSLIQSIEQFVETHNTDIYHYLLSAYVFLLHKLCSSDNILVGIKANGRTSDEVKNIYGFLDQYIPVVYQVTPSNNFSEQLKSVFREVENAYKWQFFYSPEQFSARKQIDHDFLPFLFDFEELAASYSDDKVAISLRQELEHYHDFDLLLNAMKDSSNGVLSLRFEFNAGRYDEEYIDLFISQYTGILERLLYEYAAPVTEIPYIGKKETELILNKFNQPVKEFSNGNCSLHELFEKQARSTPRNIAIIYNDKKITYKQLDELADTLARQLLSIGTRKGEIIPLLTERSDHTIIGLLGILKAGAAYLSVAATYPAERIAVMLETVSAGKIVLQERLAGLLPHTAEALHIYLDADNPGLLPQGNIFSAVTVAPEDIAYVIFTSGSTGKPKACMLMHSNIVNYILSINETVLFDESIGNFPFFTPISFDFTLTGLLGSLINGKIVYVFGEHEEIDSILEKCFNDETNIDAIKLTPSHILMLDHLPVISSKIKLVMSGGEALNKAHVDIIRRKAPAARIVNHYGPTETTVGCITGEIDTDADKVYLGKPLPCARVYITDALNRLVPVGIPGEISIGGKSVSAGYFGSEELNTEKFISDPFADGKLYKTGDIGRWLPDGTIEYFGRRDSQVKIRGNRVEPREVEEYLNSFASIEKTVVLADDDGKGNNILIAFYKNSSNADIPWPELVQFLSASLPDYMIPSFFVRVNSFPVNQNGKLDTKELLKINYRAQSGGSAILPQNATQKVLSGIWRDVLSVETISIRDNFFELGGHSLLAMQLISQIRKALNVEVSIRALFKYPTIELLQEHIDSSREIQTLAPAFVKVGPSNDIPMSYAQKRMWFLYQLNPGTTMYNIPGMMKLTGNISIQAFEKSFDYLCERHAILRTVFKSANNKLLQVINPVPFDDYFSVDDLSQYPAGHVEQYLAEITQSEYTHIFNLETGLLIKVRLVKINEQLHYLFISMHHIITDEWSMGLLVDELSKCYNAFNTGQDPGLAQIAFNYADFTVWQAALLDRVGTQQIEYWKTKLEDINPFFDLPFAKKRTFKERYAGNVIPFSIEENLSLKVRELSRNEQSSLFMTLYAAFTVLLYKYTGVRDLLVGVPVANRNYEELENMLGFFSNTIVLRTKFDGVHSFREFLAAVVEETTDSFANQDYPFEKIVEEINPERRLGYSPVFQVLFAVHNATDKKMELDGISIEDVSINEREAKYDIVVSMDDNEKLSGYLEYNADLFDEVDMHRFHGHFKSILEQITVNPGIALSDISLITEQETREILCEWNNTVTIYPEDSVPAMIERNARLHPSSIAIVHGAKQISYRQLNEDSNRLAHFLAEKLPPHSTVAVCMERSPEMLVCFIAIMKAGAAFLAIDPEYPGDRQLFMVSDASAGMVITDIAHGSLFSECQVLVYPSEISLLNNHYSSVMPEIPADPLAPAYVIYTSGSTGTPKGVAIHHKALQNLVHWYNSSFGISAGDKLTQVAGISFDASVCEIWPALCTGASLHIIDKDLLIDSAALQSWVIQQGITVCFWPTPLAELMFTLDWPSDVVLRFVLIGGAKFRRRENKNLPFSIIDNYGLAESCVISTSGRVAEDTALAATIGKPIANTCALVLDEHMRLVPAGIYGELYIGGEGLSLSGYINRPELNAERFVTNPFRELPYPTLYRTGDIGSYTATGEVLYFGRIDKQVKIRGYRIEIGEVEAAILSVPFVTTCAVVARKREGESDYLVSFVVMDGNEKELRALLHTTLPPHMVPSVIVKLDELPLTSNGKIDYRNLQNRNIDQPGKPVVPGQVSDMEKEMVGLWEQVLGVRNIGVDDNFFEIGGHSLLITMLKSRIYETFGNDLPIRFFFEFTTPRKMADEIVKLMSVKEDKAPVNNTIKRASRQQYKV